MIFHTTVLNSRGDANPLVSLINWCYISLAKVVSTDTGVPSLITKTVQFQMVAVLYWEVSEKCLKERQKEGSYDVYINIYYAYTDIYTNDPHTAYNPSNLVLTQKQIIEIDCSGGWTGHCCWMARMQMASCWLIFFVQLYPTATKRAYSSSKTVWKKKVLPCFTMFFPIEFPPFFWQSPPLLVGILKTRN